MGHAKRLMEEMDACEARGYKLPERGKKFVCNHHFSNQYIKRFINRNSHQGKCSYCGKRGPVIDLADLVEHFATRLTSYLGDIEDQCLYSASSFRDEDGELNTPGWDEYGGLIKPDNEKVYLSFDEVACSFGCLPDNDDLFDDIDKCFFVKDWIRKDPVGLEPSEELTYAWHDYSYEITKTVLNNGIEHSKPYVATDLLTLCNARIGEFGLRNAMDVVSDCADLAGKLIKILPVGSIMYRGRPDGKGKTYNKFEDLTSAPVLKAKANRLSQAEVSVFYGSFDPVTPVDEILNYWTGEKPVISLGEFETTLPLKIIDFTDVPEADFWMANTDWQDYLFLKQFHEEITRAVSDQVSHIDYVPTQVFVEVLRSHFPKLNGIKYKSSQTGEPNICLFYDQMASSRVLKLRTVSVKK